MINVNIDGSVRPNPGKGGCGIVIKGGDVDIEISRKLEGDNITNNEAEYKALCIALEELFKIGKNTESITIYTDSLLIVQQMTGYRKVDLGGRYTEPHLRAKELCKNFSDVSFIHIPRCENRQADKLAGMATKS